MWPGLGHFCDRFGQTMWRFNIGDRGFSEVSHANPKIGCSENTPAQPLSFKRKPKGKPSWTGTLKMSFSKLLVGLRLLVSPDCIFGDVTLVD